jgi:hypothetical protein
MIFLAETTFIFGSRICEADGDGNLLIDSRLHGGHSNSTTLVDQLAEEFS